MKPLTLVTLLAVVAAVAVDAPSAFAQADHLKCFKAKDSAKFNAGATLSALQTQFGIDESCQIKGKGKLFCVPVTKQVTAFEDKSKAGIPQVPITGQTLTDDRVCYKIKCPKSDIAPEVVTDQFGARSMGKFKAAFLCTPAIKGQPPSTTTTTTTTTTMFPPCGNPLYQECDGTCPAGEWCGVNALNECKCFGFACGTSSPFALPAPECSGDCPPGEVCVDVDGTTCACATSPGTPCTSSGEPQCDGDCPSGQVCRLGIDDMCQCVSSHTCQDIGGVCQGFCPDGGVCVDDAGACVCQ